MILSIATRAAIFLMLLPVPLEAQQLELLMFEEEGCIYCARWNAEAGDAYAKTPEGRAAPLRRIDIDDPLPDEISLDGDVVFTPTFVLALDGAEISRLEGYASEDFFWSLLQQMLIDAGETAIAE